MLASHPGHIRLPKGNDRRPVESLQRGGTDRISELPCSESGQNQKLAGGVDRFGGVPVAKRSPAEVSAWRKCASAGRQVLNKSSMPRMLKITSVRRASIWDFGGLFEQVFTALSLSPNAASQLEIPPRRNPT